VDRLRAAGQWCEGDPPILVVFDAGYDITRLAWLLRDLPVMVLGRVRSDRVFYLPPRRVPRARSDGHAGTARRWTSTPRLPTLPRT
jgi:hypothetical protein